MTIGVKTFDYFINPVATFETHEGDLTVTLDNAVWDDGSTDKTHSFAAPIVKDNLLIQHEGAGTTNFVVANRANTDQNLIGVAAANAKPLKGVKTIPDVAGVTSNLRREVAVEIFASFIRSVPLNTGGTAVVIAQSLQPDNAGASTIHQWEGAGALNNHTFVVNIDPVGDGSKATALFGYWGNF